MRINQTLDLRPDSFRSILLFLLALANYGLMYSANIILTHLLTIEAFDDYSVAVSIVTMLSTIATLGLEKYALRAVTIFQDHQDWRGFRGFWLFSLRVTTGFSVLLMLLLGAGLETVLMWHKADYHMAIVAFTAFLPIIGITLFLVEVTAALGAYLFSIFVYRFLLPLLYVLLLLIVSISTMSLSALLAVICFGIAWTIALFILWRVARLLIPVQVFQSKPSWQGRMWLKNSLPLVTNSLMLTIVTSSGVVILEFLFPSDMQVGLYAVVAQTGSFISLVGTSTNRYYLPIMAILIDHQDYQGILTLMRQRTLIVGSLILGILIVIATKGYLILSLFGQHFITGYEALVIVAVGAAFSALFADIPYYLQYMGFHRTVLSMTFVATLSTVVFGLFLGRNYGAIGVASAYMTSVMLLFLSLRVIVNLRFRQIVSV